jgi:hypothetical protein
MTVKAEYGGGRRMRSEDERRQARKEEEINAVGSPIKVFISRS